MWCLGYIIPIYKNKGSVDDPNNYRGITQVLILGSGLADVLLIQISGKIPTTASGKLPTTKITLRSVEDSKIGPRRKIQKHPAENYQHK